MKEESKKALQDLKLDIDTIRKFINNSDEVSDVDEIYRLYKNVYLRCLNLTEDDFKNKEDFVTFNKHMNSTGQHKFEIYLLKNRSKLATHDEFIQIESSLEKLFNYITFFDKGNA